MVFNDTSTKQGIVQDTLFTIFGNSADNSQYPTADITRNINRHYDAAVAKILESDGRWQWDDTNATDLPIGTTNLVANQQDYGVDTTFLRITRVELTKSDGTTTLLQPIDQTDIYDQSLTSYFSTPGTPMYYDKLANSLFLYPAPSYNYTGGLKVYFQRNVSYFTATDTTKSPGFASPFHRLLSLGAAYDFMLPKNYPQLGVVKNEINEMSQALQDFYSKRDKDGNIHLGVRRQIWR